MHVQEYQEEQGDADKGLEARCEGGRLVLRVGLPPEEKGIQKCCNRHNKDLEAMRFQAQKSGEAKVMADVEADPSKLALALDEFDRMNPPGRFRKQLIDWTQFKKRHTHTTKKIDQEKEEEYTYQDFKDEKTAAGS